MHPLIMTDFTAKKGAAKTIQTYRVLHLRYHSCLGMYIDKKNGTTQNNTDLQGRTACQISFLFGYVYR